MNVKNNDRGIDIDLIYVYSASVHICELLATIVFISENHYIHLMTIEQKKIALINWITNLNDETIINEIESFRSASLRELPKEIVELLQISDSTNKEDCIEHSNSRSILGR